MSVLVSQVPTTMHAFGTPQSPRSTCLYCAQRGETVDLVPFLHWGICPVCDPDRARAIQTPDPEKGKPWPRPS